MAVFVVVLGAVLVVFGALALRLDLKDRRFVRGSGRRGSVRQHDIRKGRLDIEARAAEMGLHPNQQPPPPVVGGF